MKLLTNLFCRHKGNPQAVQPEPVNAAYYRFRFSCGTEVMYRISSICDAGCADKMLSKSMEMGVIHAIGPTAYDVHRRRDEPLAEEFTKAFGTRSAAGSFVSEWGNA